MRINASATSMGILVLVTESQIDPRATQRLRDDREIEKDALRDAIAFRPILTINLTADDDTTDVRVAVNYNFKKDGQLLWRWAEGWPYEPTKIYQPQRVLNLAAYQQGDQMVGKWEVQTRLTFFSKAQLEAVPAGKKRDFIMGGPVNGRRLDYLEVATFEWEVLAQAPTALDATGMRVRPQRQTRYTDRSYTLDDI